MAMLMFVSGKAIARASMQWQPTLTFHDPSPPLPLENVPSEFPIVAAISTAFTNANSIPDFSMPLMDPIDAGDLLIITMVFGGDWATINTPSGWTLLGTANISGYTWGTYARKSDGSEAGTSVTFTFVDTPDQASGQAYRIINWRDSGTLTNDVEISHTNVTTTTTPDPPSLNPTNWDVEKTLWITFAAGGLTHTITNFPYGYYGGLHTVSAAWTGLSSAWKESEVAAEDPGAFTVGTALSFRVVTLGIRPVASAVAIAPVMMYEYRRRRVA